MVASKNFEAEAKIVLQRTNMDLNQEAIDLTAKLLELSLVEYILENGFPDFSEVKDNFLNCLVVENI